MKVAVLLCVVVPIATVFWMITIPCLLIKTIIDEALFPCQNRFTQAQGTENEDIEPCDVRHKIIANVHGNAVNGLLFESSAQAPRGVHIIFHPNAVTATSYAQIKEELINNITASGHHCLFAEYPGYSDSGGNICCDSDFQAAADAFYQLACNRFPDCSITLYGFSIGTWAVAYLAGKYPQQIERAVLCAPFAKVNHLIAHHGQQFLAELGCQISTGCIDCITKLCSLYNVNNADSMANYVGSNPDAEIVITHSYGDSIIPYQHSMNIAAACEHAKEHFFHNQKIRCIPLAHHYGHTDLPWALEEALFSSDVFDMDFDWLQEPPRSPLSEEEENDLLISGSADNYLPRHNIDL